MNKFGVRATRRRFPLHRLVDALPPMGIIDLNRFFEGSGCKDNDAKPHKGQKEHLWPQDFESNPFQKHATNDNQKVPQGIDVC